MAGRKERGAEAAETRQPRLLYLGRRWFVAWRAALETVTRDHGLTTGDYVLLSFLDRRGPCSGADIARAAHITPQAATQQIAQLEAKQMIVRRENPANRRIALNELTPRGRAALADIDRRADAIEEGLTEGMGASEIETIRTFLLRRPDARPSTAQPAASDREEESLDAR